ncbi:hypothetical protein [Paenibacillus thermotolerans]|uniref:hypothetical protein n=1 Tax=Paenibacillus thermotolerans TaxID=3027807 RepID=UPI002367D051|nr:MULTISPECIES: hypothetical protein [unclassified Paenibacillus]
MSHEKRRYVKAPIRPDLDDDIVIGLADYLKRNPDQTVADVVRQGVRIVLGITTYRAREVSEKQLPLPRDFIANRARRDSNEHR